MKDYLGLDIGQLKNEIADEMNKNNTNGNQGEMMCTQNKVIFVFLRFDDIVKL